MYLFNVFLISDVGDCWISEYCNGFGLPAGVSNELFERVLQQPEWYFRSIYNYPNTLAFSTPGIGLYMNEVLDELKEKAQTPSDSNKFVLYAAHDTTIMVYIKCFTNQSHF